MITNDRMLHTLSVARMAYKLAQRRGYDEEFCCKMFMLGFIHDVGYEFIHNDAVQDHADISAYLLELVANDECIKVIANHGKVVNEEDMSPEHLYLNAADMSVNSVGDYVSVEQRLNDIRLRYGQNSPTYKVALAVCEQLKLPLEV